MIPYPETLMEPNRSHFLAHVSGYNWELYI